MSRLRRDRVSLGLMRQCAVYMMLVAAGRGGWHEWELRRQLDYAPKLQLTEPALRRTLRQLAKRGLVERVDRLGRTREHTSWPYNCDRCWRAV